MSEDASENSPWPTAPDFGDSPRGYWGYEVDRLLEELKAADAAGESLGPVIDKRKLSEVGFGYSMPEVDAYLALLRRRTATRTTSASSIPESMESGAAPAATGPTAPPPPASSESPSSTFTSSAITTPGVDDPSVPRNEPPAPKPAAVTAPVQDTLGLASSAVTAFPSRSGAEAAMLAEIELARSLPRPPGRAAGYAAADVDTFFSELANAIRADQYVVTALQTSRFAMARGGAPGYDVKEVDLLLDRLEGMASGAASPQQRRSYEPNPYDQRSVERNPYQGFSAPAEVKPGRSKSIVRTVISTAIFIFILYNFFRVWSGFGF